MDINDFIPQAGSYRQLMENISVLVYIYRNSRVIYVNPAVEKALGFTFEEMTQKNFGTSVTRRISNWCENGDWNGSRAKMSRPTMSFASLRKVAK